MSSHLFSVMTPSFLRASNEESCLSSIGSVSSNLWICWEEEAASAREDCRAAARPATEALASSTCALTSSLINAGVRGHPIPHHLLLAAVIVGGLIDLTLFLEDADLTALGGSEEPEN